MRSATLFSPSVYRAALFLFILFLLFNSAYSQLTDADHAKKETRSLFAQLQNSETTKSTLTVKKNKLDQIEKGINQEAIAVLAKQKIHDANQPPPWDPAKPKPQYAIDYDNEKKQIEDKKADILKKLKSILAKKDSAQSLLDSLNIEIRSQRGVLRVKGIKVQDFFNPTNCGQMPGEVATVAEWKSYLDCLFDGTPRNHVDFKDPDKPGDIKVSPNTDPNIIIPDNNPLEREKKLKEIKRMIDESNNNNKPNQPVVVAPPTGNNTNEKGGSLSDALKSLIYQVRNKIK